MTEIARDPFISVLIPAYNHASYVEEAVRSVWSQGESDVEIIALDDGSKDGTYDVLKGLHAQSPIPMRIGRHENCGLVRTVNRMLRSARGEYVLCLASDDKLLDGGLTAAARELRTGPAPLFAMFNARYFGDSNAVVYSDKVRAFLRGRIDGIVRELYVDPPKPLLLQCTMIRRSELVAMGGWSEDVTLDDWPTFIRLFERVRDSGAVWRFCPDLLLSGYRIHNSNAHRNVARQIRMCEEVIERFCPEPLRPEAKANTYVDYGLSALRRRDASGVRLLRDAVRASSLPLVTQLIWSKVVSYYTARA
jgi:glycosyltransferase involved in cell wall biosynthesis